MLSVAFWSHRGKIKDQQQKGTWEIKEYAEINLPKQAEAQGDHKAVEKTLRWVERDARAAQAELSGSLGL